VPEALPFLTANTTLELLRGAEVSAEDMAVVVSLCSVLAPLRSRVNRSLTEGKSGLRKAAGGRVQNAALVALTGFWRAGRLACRRHSRAGARPSLASELVALNQALQPKPRICDSLNAANCVGYVQEIRLDALWNIVPKEYCGAPKLGQRNLVPCFAGMKVHSCYSPPSVAMNWRRLTKRAR
jgi:hypothetical protein